MSRPTGQASPGQYSGLDTGVESGVSLSENSQQMRSKSRYYALHDNAGSKNSRKEFKKYFRLKYEFT